MLKTILLGEIAHCRVDGNESDCLVSVIAREGRDYAPLREQVTVQAVRRLYGAIATGYILRHEVPAMSALNFVMERVEDGSTRTPACESSDQALSSLMLALPVQVRHE